MKNNLSACCLSVSLAATSWFAMPGMAATAESAGQLEEITVTATKRSEDPQKVPISMNVLSGDDLEKTGTVNLFDGGASMLPGLFLSKTLNIRSTTIQIRGIGSFGGNVGIEPSVGQYIDGVYLPQNAAINQNLMDIQDIEVLKGPQGTLFGRNTPIGAININTREPQAQTEGMLRATTGNFNSVRAAGYYGGEIASGLDGRVSAWATHHDGYENNLWDGRNVNDDSEQGIRVRLKWHPSDNFTDNVIAYYSEINENCCSPELAYPTTPGLTPFTPGYLGAAAAVGYPVTKFTTGDHTVDESVIGKQHVDLYGLSNQADYRFGGDYTLTSITAMNAFGDKDLPLGLGDGFPQPSYFSNQRNFDRTFSEELRITSPTGRTIDYVGGVYLFRQQLDYSTAVGLTGYSNAQTPSGPLFPAAASGADVYFYSFHQIADSEAAFAQATWNISPSLRAVGGLRETAGHKGVDVVTTNAPNADFLWGLVFPPTPLQHFSVSDSKLTWLASVQYDVSDRVMLYASSASGFKDGGVSSAKQGGGIASATNPYTFNPETSINYEVGMKSTFLDRKILLNVDVYHIVENNLQQSFFVQVPGGATAISVIGNVGNYKVEGFEWEAAYKPIQQLTLTTGGLVDKAEIQNYSNGPCSPKTYVPAGILPGTCNYDGLRPPRSPSLTYVWSADWQQPITNSLAGYLRLNGSYSSGFYIDDTLDYRTYQHAYSLVDARIGVTADKHWDAALWCKNLTDKAYYTANNAAPGSSGQSSGSFAVNPSGEALYYAPPRTYGVEVSYRF